MAAPATSPPSLLHSDERASSRKAVGESGLVTVEMSPAGFGLMLNVSAKGIGVYTLTSLKQGQNVQVSFLLPTSSALIECTGQVRWAIESHAGLQLMHLHEKSAAALDRWVSTSPELPGAKTPRFQRRQFPALDEQFRALEAQIISENLKPDESLQILLSRIVELTRAKGGAVALENSGKMICRASAGLAPEVGVLIGSGSGLTGECIRTGKIIYCEDTELDPRVDREACRELNLSSSLIVPIISNSQKVWGVVELFSPQPRAFGNDHQWLAQRMADLAARIEQSPRPAVAILEATELPEKDLVNLAAAQQPGKAVTAQRSKPAQTIEVAPDQSAKPAAPEHNLGVLKSAGTGVAIAAMIGIACLSAAWQLAHRSSSSKPMTSAIPTTVSSPASPTSAPTPVVSSSPKPASSEPVQKTTSRKHDPTIVAADSVTTPVRTLPPAEGKPLTDDPQVVAPAVQLSSTANLSGVVLPATFDTPALRAATVSGGSLVHRVEPTYPMLALKRRLEGEVVLQARIDKDGNVTRVRLVKGSPILGAAAIAAVRQWHYEPFKRNSVAQEVDSTIKLAFHIQKPVWLR